MKIGIDIDNTLCKTSFMASKIYNNLYNKDFNELSKIEQYEFCARYESEIFDNCKLEDNAKEIINKLYNEDNYIYFVTSRSNDRVFNIEKRTIDYLNNNGILYTDIFFGSTFKYDIYKKLNLDVMIDDDADVYLAIKNSGGNCILYDGILNKNIKEDKVKNWKELYNYLKGENYGQ